MSTIRPRVIALVDLGPGCRRVLDAATRIAREKNACLTVLHVLDYSPPDEADFPTISPREECATLEAIARVLLRRLAWRVGCPDADLRVVVGIPDSELQRLADELGADTVVRRHWWPRLSSLLEWFTAAREPAPAYDVIRV